MGWIRRTRAFPWYFGFDNYLRVEYSIRVSVRKFCKGFFFVFPFFYFWQKEDSMPLIFLRSKYNRIFPWFFPREIPWIDRNTNRVRFTPFAVHPLLRGRCNARGVDFTIFSDRFHYTGTSVPIRPRRLKNSSLRLSVPVLVLGNLEDIFMFGAGNRRLRV